MNLQELSIEELKTLHETAKERKAEEQSAIDEIDAEMVRRFKVDKDHIGTRSFDEASFTVHKNVSWDQDALGVAAETIKGWKQPVADYIDTTMKVTESKWNAWPETVRKVFEPARSVKSGKVKVVFK